MILLLNKTEKEYSPDETITGPSVILADYNERNAALKSANIEIIPVFTDNEQKVIRFESGNKYDYISIFVSTPIEPGEKPFLIEIYINQDFLVVIGDNPVIDRFRDDIATHTMDTLTTQQMLSILFNQVLSRNHDLLDTIEDEIAKLEETATMKNPGNHSKDIIALRKKLLILKRYFEEIYALFEELEENQNNIYSRDNLKAFRVQRGKVNRLLNTVMSLRDYLSQVRETYQNQLDIELNNTMQFFTVVTSIFLPLTLLVGWYGMNLNMPELKSDLAYPIVIIASLVYVILAVIFCKRKGWF
ncbi:MAG TPA: magnesium transporter [Mogibacterium sp.]|nr:magnesium transporter [Mogibacterium sp.]